MFLQKRKDRCKALRRCIFKVYLLLLLLEFSLLSAQRIQASFHFCKTSHISRMWQGFLPSRGHCNVHHLWIWCICSCTLYVYSIHRYSPFFFAALVNGKMQFLICFTFSISSVFSFQANLEDENAMMLFCIVDIVCIRKQLVNVGTNNFYFYMYRNKNRISSALI